jgi:hypothetical protein
VEQMEGRHGNISAHEGHVGGGQEYKHMHMKKVRFRIYDQGVIGRA